MTTVKVSEHDEQASIFEYFAYRANQSPEWALLYAVPNGGDRHPAVAAKLKDEGVKAGVPDIVWPVPRGIYAGFYGELKVGSNKPTKQQLWWLGQLAQQGYYVTVQYGAEAMIRELEHYADGRVRPGTSTEYAIEGS